MYLNLIWRHSDRHVWQGFMIRQMWYSLHHKIRNHFLVGWTATPWKINNKTEMNTTARTSRISGFPISYICCIHNLTYHKIAAHTFLFTLLENWPYYFRKCNIVSVVKMFYARYALRFNHSRAKRFIVHVKAAGKLEMVVTLYFVKIWHCIILYYTIYVDGRIS